MTTDSLETQAIYGDGLYIEITPAPAVAAEEEGEGIAGSGKTVDLAERLAEVGDKVGEVCATLQSKALAAIKGVKPDEFEIEFGVKLAGEAGIPLVSKGSGECNFVVRATWKNLDSGADPAGTGE
jgi:hypothetical protein